MMTMSALNAELIAIVEEDVIVMLAHVSVLVFKAVRGVTISL